MKELPNPTFPLSPVSLPMRCWFLPDGAYEKYDEPALELELSFVTRLSQKLLKVSSSLIQPLRNL